MSDLFLQTSDFPLHTSQSSPDPIIVKIIQPPRDPTGLTEVLIGSLGLTGAIVLLAVVCGVVLAGVMLWVRSRSSG